MNKVLETIKKNWIFTLIISLAVILRIYYFFITANQTVWWDDAEYLSTAIHWVTNIPYEINSQRPIILPLLESFILFIGGSEILIKFLLVVLPSIGIVIVTYLIGLTQAFNNFYGNSKIIGSPKESYYLALTKAFAQVLKNGLTVLGISAPERM